MQMKKRLYNEPIADDDVRQVLSELGIFTRNFLDQSGFANALWRFWGYLPGDMDGEFWHEIVDPEDRDRVVAAEEAIKNGHTDSFEQEYRIHTGTGEVRWILSRGKVVSWDDDGNPEWYVGTDLDITSQKESEHALTEAKREAEQRAQEAETLRIAGAIVASSLDIQEAVSLILDQTLRVVPCETATVQLLTDTGLKIIGGKGWEDPDTILGYNIPIPGDSPHARIIERGEPCILSDLTAEYPDFAARVPTRGGAWMGIPLVVQARTIGLMQFETGETEFFTRDHLRLALSLADHVAVALFNARLYEETRRLAQTDSLTGVQTRRSFSQQAEEILANERRNANDLALLMLDVDHFKLVNDDFGHVVGDAVLVQIARACMDVLRASDIVGRYGGEEFVILLPATRKQDAIRIAERVQDAVRGIELPAKERHITVSIGITNRPGKRRKTPALTFEQYLNEADRALYRAKQNGRDRWEYIPLQ
jgi:diguanylate cyclase (GGDEF)-like protein/PAS domain S-box-containing protein